MEGAEWQENLEKPPRIWRNLVKNPKQATRFATFLIMTEMTITVSFADHRDGFDFDQIFFADELFHHNQRAGGRSLRVDVIVPYIAHSLYTRRVCEVVVELDHVFERGSSFFQSRLEVFKDLFDLCRKIV